MDDDYLRLVASLANPQLINELVELVAAFISVPGVPTSRTGSRSLRSGDR